MKTIFVLIITLFLPFIANAQNGNYGRVDVEFGLDAALIGNSFESTTNHTMPGFHFEIRFQVKENPVNGGFHFGTSTIKRKYSDGTHANFTTAPFLLVTDYQFGRGTNINPFVGLGMGLSINSSRAVDDEVTFALSPRVGVRFFKFYSATLGYLATQQDFSRLYFSLGFYF